MTLFSLLKKSLTAVLLIPMGFVHLAFSQPPLSAKATIRFLAPVNAQTVNNLLNTIDQARKSGAQEIDLLLSSPGGEVVYGLSAYNYLKALPIELVTYNFGAVDSIAVALYCAGQERLSVANGEFLLHGLAAQFPPMPIEQDLVEQELRQMQNQTDALAGVVSTCTGRSVTEVEDAVKHKTVLSAKDALKWGLVQKIAPLPAGTETMSVVNITPDNLVGVSVSAPSTGLSNIPMWTGVTPDVTTTGHVSSFP
jgi:ATP-dependent protease ClpP protease subunit